MELGRRGRTSFSDDTVAEVLSSADDQQAQHVSRLAASPAGCWRACAAPAEGRLPSPAIACCLHPLPCILACYVPARMLHIRRALQQLPSAPSSPPNESAGRLHSAALKALAAGQQGCAAGQARHARQRPQPGPHRAAWRRLRCLLEHRQRPRAHRQRPPAAAAAFQGAAVAAALAAAQAGARWTGRLRAPGHQQQLALQAGQQRHAPAPDWRA
jgi:hypothetical protein